MTIAELIDKLLKLPQDAEVWVDAGDDSGPNSDEYVPDPGLNEDGSVSL